jgi:hypothetical protein
LTKKYDPYSYNIRKKAKSREIRGTTVPTEGYKQSFTTAFEVHIRRNSNYALTTSSAWRAVRYLNGQHAKRMSQRRQQQLQKQNTANHHSQAK